MALAWSVYEPRCDGSECSSAPPRQGRGPSADKCAQTAIAREGDAATLSAPGNRRRQTGLPMASIRLRARQRALKTNWWVALMFSCLQDNRACTGRQDRHKFSLRINALYSLLRDRRPALRGPAETVRRGSIRCRKPPPGVPARRSACAAGGAFRTRARSARTVHSGNPGSRSAQLLRAVRNRVQAASRPSARGASACRRWRKSCALSPSGSKRLPDCTIAVPL